MPVYLATTMNLQVPHKVITIIKIEGDETTVTTSSTRRILVIQPEQGKPLGAVLCKVSTEDAGGAYTILELVLQPGQGAPPHVHALEDEIFHVVEGMCEVGQPGKTRSAGAGTIAVFPRGALHLFRNTGDEPCRVMITAIPGGLDRYFEELSQIAAGDPEAAQKVTEINARYQIRFEPSV
jgi:quercetin dioxygenase-like cupin family protein